MTQGTRIVWDKDELAKIKQHIHNQPNQNRPEAELIKDAQKAVLPIWRHKEVEFHSTAKRLMKLIYGARDLEQVAPVVIVERKKTTITVFEDQVDVAVRVLLDYGLDVPK